MSYCFIVFTRRSRRELVCLCAAVTPALTLSPDAGLWLWDMEVEREEVIGLRLPVLHKAPCVPRGVQCGFVGSL